MSDLATLAALLDEFEGAQDNLKAANARRNEVKARVREELGVTDGYISDDKLVGALLRALVKAREVEREEAPGER